jgi:hypothetical protein
MTYTCKACGHERVPVQQSPGPLEPPGPGDFWICPRCGQIHRFMNEGTIVVLSRGMRFVTLGLRRAEMEELLELDEADRVKLLALRDDIRAAAGHEVHRG